MTYKIKQKSFRKSMKEDSKEAIDIKLVGFFEKIGILKTIAGTATIMILIGSAVFFAGKGAKESIKLSEYNASKSYNKEKPEEMKKAIEIYRKLAEENPSRFGFYYLQIGNIHNDLDQHDQAIKSYELASNKVKTPSMLPVINLKSAYLHLKTGNTEKAKELFNKVIDSSLAYNKDMAYLELARLSQSSGDLKEAEKFYDAVVKGFPDTPSASEAQAKLNVIRKDQTGDKEDQLKKDAAKASEIKVKTGKK